MTEPNTRDHLAEDHEQHAGADTDDGFAPKPVDRTGGTPADEPGPPVVSGPDSGAKTQQPETEEFGRRAVESGDPDDEDTDEEQAAVTTERQS